ncbi:MAG: hypothetical protein A3E85_04900 [Gammaproteobacteria bacterium RIFCSPHIGHO2_12_FULL_45_12]|nr:MAG: hypothetical protein A3E85_04900 [Gammaproteobacteria bacterium RIFCSPHIGHO2_12_FULL_45_12]
MDARHQSVAEETLNQLVNFMNQYLQTEMDQVLAIRELHTDMRKILKYIYQYAKLEVDVDAILSKQNLLSVDRVGLPRLDNLLIPDKNSFMRVIDAIQAVLNQLDKGNRSPQFVAQVNGILEQYLRLHRHW